MAKLSGIALRTLQDIKHEGSERSVQTMNRIFGMPGLKPGIASKGSTFTALPVE